MRDALTPLLVTYVVLVGAALGSFVNVVVARLPLGLSIVRPRSRCPACERTIRWYDNVPIVSYLLLRGRCRGCKAHIAIRYLLVELLMAALAGGLWTRFGWSLELAVWLLLVAALLAVLFLDIDYWWVPDVITFPAMALAAAASLLPGGLTPAQAAIGLAPAALLWAVAWGFERLTGREGMGLGDVKLLALIGLAVGAVDALSVLLLAALQGVVLGAVVLVTGGHRGAGATTVGGDTAGDDWVPPPRAIPFGPFLVLATLEVVLLPGQLGALPMRLASWLLEGWGP
ncbi:MAG: prepilin peptidase [Myxococcota bacterium]